MMFVFAGFCRGPVDVDVVVDEGQRDPELFFAVVEVLTTATTTMKGMMMISSSSRGQRSPNEEVMSPIQNN